MTFPLGSLRSEGAAPGKGSERRAESTASSAASSSSSARVTGRLHRVPPPTIVEQLEPVENTFRFQALLFAGGVVWLLALLACLGASQGAEMLRRRLD